MMMTIDEAITHCEDISRSCDSLCGREHKQLAEWLKELKSLKPKTGEWKPKNHHTDYCSNCGFEETQWRTTDYNFCPSCGARMKGADYE